MTVMLCAVLTNCSTEKIETGANLSPQPTPPTQIAETPGQEGNMNENVTNVMQTSNDSKEVLTAALVLARSKNPTDHQKLQAFLGQQTFLAKLDSPEEYRNATAKRLRISKLLEALSTNDEPSAHTLYISLTKNEVFLAEGARTDELIRFSKDIRNQANLLTAFWDKYSQPDDGFVNLTIQALIKNGTASAMTVLEKKMADAKHEDDDKTAWMRIMFVPNRDDLELLKSCERMLSGKLPTNLRPYLVEVIFDYKPAEWYSPHSAVNPPDRQKTDAKVREQLNRVAQIALKLGNVTPAQKQAVQNTLKEIGY